MWKLERHNFTDKPSESSTDFENWNEYARWYRHGRTYDGEDKL